MKALRTPLILVLSFACLANMLAALIPPGTETGQRLEKTLVGPRWTTGTWQIWDMFQTIPLIHRPSFKIVAKDAGGREHAFGLVLPGLREFDPKEEIRYHYTFLRMFSEKSYKESYVEAYARAVAAELEKKDLGLVEFSIVTEHEYTRHLHHIRKEAEELWRNAPDIQEAVPVAAMERKESESFPIPFRR